MVDAGAGFFGSREATVEGAARPARGLSPSTLADYVRFATAARCAPAQSPIWLAAWTAHVEGDYAFVIVGGDSGARLALPLEIVRHGPFRVARFISGRHANGNFPPFVGAGAFSFAEIATAIRSARPDVDLVLLERLAPNQDGVANPLAAHATQESPNVALAVNLGDGFDALLDRVSGKRKRKKHRWQARKFEAAGGHRIVQAKSEAEVGRLLDAFLAMKAERFRRMGIADVFAEAGVQAAFRAIFRDALADPARPFVLHGLEVGGRLRAVTGSSRCGGRVICEFGAIAEDDMSSTSPGEFLFFENIREACEDGYDFYDFGVGDESYKRMWCDIETRHFDVLIPLNAKGGIFAVLIAARSRLKRFVKQNAFLWNAVKRLRRRSATSAAPSEADGD